MLKTLAKPFPTPSLSTSVSGTMETKCVWSSWATPRNSQEFIEETIQHFILCKIDLFFNSSFSKLCLWCAMFCFKLLLKHNHPNFAHIADPIPSTIPYQNTRPFCTTLRRHPAVQEEQDLEPKSTWKFSQTIKLVQTINCSRGILSGSWSKWKLPFSQAQNAEYSRHAYQILTVCFSLCC